MKLIWNTETEEIVKAEDYQFETKIDDNIFDGEKYIMTTELGESSFTKDKYEALAFWDNAKLNPRGYILHCFESDEAIEYIANDMLSCDNTNGNAYLYSQTLTKIAKFLED